MLTYRSARDVDNGNYTKVFRAADFTANLPDTVDWRTKNAVTDIKNQVRNIGHFNCNHYKKLSHSYIYKSSLSLPPSLSHSSPPLSLSPVLTQDQCGASYAFSAMGALEGAWALAHEDLNELSEQNIIDCSGTHKCCTAHFFKIQHPSFCSTSESECFSLPKKHSSLWQPRVSRWEHVQRLPLCGVK